MPTLTRFTRPLIATSLLTLVLAGCGGDSNNGNDAQAGMCAGTAPVAAVKGYPAYTPDAGIYADEDASEYKAAACNMVAHYNAGYAIVMTEDADPWTDGDKATHPVIESAKPLATSDPQPGDEQQINQVASGTPVYQRYAEGYREIHVMATLPGGQGEPWECDELAPASQEQAAPGNCLATLRELDAQNPPSTKQRPSTRLAKSDTGTGTYGDAIPDKEEWTLLGGKAYQLQYARETNRWWEQAPLSGKKIGNINTAFDVYRLNGVESFDYFLVKAKWSMSPESYWGSCSKGLQCAFFNNEHKLGFVLQRKHKGAAKLESGDLVSYVPQNIVRKQTYTTKIGGKLNFGAKVDGGLTAEVSTSYTYSAASISAKENHDQSVLFKVSHATGRGLGFGIMCDLCDDDPTTIGTMPTTVWALYRFPRTDLDTQAGTEMIVNVNEQSGYMGMYHDAWGTLTYPYRVVDKDDSSRAYAFSYALPYFSVKQVDADGKLIDLPRSATNPLKLKRGQVLQLRIETGGTMENGTPITLGWQIINPPSFLTIPNTTGSTSSTIDVVVRGNAPAGEVEYLKFNTKPRAAAPGMDGTDLAIPIQIME